MRGIELAAGAALGLFAGFLLWGVGSDDAAERTAEDGPSLAAPPPETASELQALKARLEREETRRMELESEIAARPPVAAPAPEKPPQAAKPEPGKPPGDWIDDRVLRDAGFGDSELDALDELYESTELERLFVRDQAKREGWLRSQRYRQRMRELNSRYDALRFEYGEDRFDWILFATGRPNRIRVDRVLRDSAAAEIGLEVGDLILRYDDERVFDTPSLQQATGEGRAGETVALDVDRGGERVRLYLPRGPLGIVLGAARKKPGAIY